LSRITSKPSKAKKEGKKSGGAAASNSAAADVTKFSPSTLNLGLGTGDTGDRALDCTGLCNTTLAVAAPIPPAGLSALEAQLGAANRALQAQVAQLEARQLQSARELQRATLAYHEVVRLKDEEITRLRADLNKKRNRDENTDDDNNFWYGDPGKVLSRTPSLPLAKRIKPEPLADTSLGAAPDHHGLGTGDEADREITFESLSRAVSLQSTFSTYDDFFAAAQLFAVRPRTAGEASPTAVFALPEDFGKLLDGE
jgi:hypothetical protein